MYMGARRVSPRWRQRIETKLERLEERIGLGLKGERRDREADGAHTDEEIHRLEERILSIEEEQVRLGGRLGWLEKRVPSAGRPPKPRKKI